MRWYRRFVVWVALRLAMHAEDFPRCCAPVKDLGDGVLHWCQRYDGHSGQHYCCPPAMMVLEIKDLAGVKPVETDSKPKVFS